MRHWKTEGIVLKRQNFSESGRIITVFSKKNGKIKIKAPGVRKINSRRSSHIELLNYSFFTLYEGRNLPTLVEASTIKSFSRIKDELKKIKYAYHICELVDGLCPENQENIEVFSLLNNTLDGLEKTENYQQVVENFEINILTLLGFLKPGISTKIDTTNFIEQILERKLKSKRMQDLL